MDAQTSLRLALTGDSMIVRHAFVEQAQDAATRELVALLRDADVAFTNLESLPNGFRGYAALDNGGTHMSAPPWVIDDLVAAGFDLFAAATNHALDYSIEGLLAAIEALESRGVAFAGIGRNLAEARMPAYLEHPKGSVALIACVSSFARGQIAAEQRPELPGRPGVNPLRHETTYEIPPEDLAALQRIAGQLGLEQKRLDLIQLGFAFPPDNPDLFPFLGANFTAAPQAAVKTAPNKKDAEAIAKWVGEARNRADLVVLSLHNHEEGGSKEEPAAFARDFAHQMIEAGADLVVGHGSHLLRGMELYQGKPIFYSLGNFIAQNDLIERMPADGYDRFRVDPSATPSEIFLARSQHGEKGFPADRRYWETVVPICDIHQGALQAIELVPVTLGHGEPPHRRGRPRLAHGDLARSILERFAALSQPYGTELELGGERALVRLS
ncbi:MAG TPA: CapA family protein [Thermomicrobiaceae bacterium]|nr:CapA family protein [Thermomicrobiaceae bacterium]